MAAILTAAATAWAKMQTNLHEDGATQQSIGQRRAKC